MKGATVYNDSARVQDTPTHLQQQREQKNREKNPDKDHAVLHAHERTTEKKSC